MAGQPELHMSIESELLSIHVDTEIMASVPLITSEYLISYANKKIHIFGLNSLMRGDDKACHSVEIGDHVTSFGFDHTRGILIVSTPTSLRTISIISEGDHITSDGTSTWRHGHKGYICRIVCGRDFVATGGSDGSLRLWTCDNTECIHSRPPTASCITLLRDLPCGDKIDLLVCADRQLAVFLIDKTGKGRPSVQEIFTDANAHSSQVIDMLNIGSTLITLGLDKVLCVWTMRHEDAMMNTKGVHIQLASRVLSGNADVCGLIKYDTNEFYCLDRQRCVRQCRLGEDGALSISNQPRHLAGPHTQDCTLIYSQNQPTLFGFYSDDDGILDFYAHTKLVHRRSILMDTTKLQCISSGSVSNPTLILQSGTSLIRLRPNCRMCERFSLPDKLMHAAAFDDATYLVICCGEPPGGSKIRIVCKNGEDYNVSPEQLLFVEDDVSCMDLFVHKTNVYLAVGMRNGSFIIKQDKSHDIRRSPPGKMYDMISLIRWVSANTVVMCSFEGKIKDSPPVLFNTKKDEFTKLHVHKPSLRAVDVQLSPRDMIAVAYSDGSTHLYNSSSGQCIQTIESPTIK